MLPSRIDVSPPSPARSRCFRTDAHGYIPLRRDWPALFEAMRPAGSLALQTRHTYARLIHLGPVPEIVWEEVDESLVGRDRAGTLHLDTALWGPARGRLALCECCDSPGTIDILNKRGGDILQFCAAAETAPAAWAACLEVLLETVPPSPPHSRQDGFPLVPAGLHPLREPVGMLMPLLAALGHEDIPVLFLLRTPEVSHRRHFVPRRVTTAFPLLTATDGRTTLQLALPPVRRALVAPDLSLHLAGPGDTLLLSLSCLDAHATAWRAALATAFPSLRSFPSTA